MKFRRDRVLLEGSELWGQDFKLDFQPSNQGLSQRGILLYHTMIRWFIREFPNIPRRTDGRFGLGITIVNQ